MKKKNLIVLKATLLCVLLSACAVQSQKKIPAELWVFDSLTAIHGHSVEQMGQPTLVTSSLGKAVSFDGDGDRLLINANPLGDATEFTIEIIFKANDVFPKNHEPRLFHIESPDNSARRITLELRLNDQQQWYFDAFIKTEKSQLTLIDPTKVHPVSEWVHAAITYKAGEFSSYVNGKKELTGAVEYLTIPANAKTSVGARMNQIHWFNGSVLQVSVAKKALATSDFLLLKKLSH